MKPCFVSIKTIIYTYGCSYGLRARHVMVETNMKKLQQVSTCILWFLKINTFVHMFLKLVYLQYILACRVSIFNKHVTSITNTKGLFSWFIDTLYLHQPPWLQKYIWTSSLILAISKRKHFVNFNLLVKSWILLVIVKN